MAKRGRPSLPLPDEPASLTRRQQANRWYAGRAMAAITGMSCADYFNGTGGRGQKVSLLAELGRLGDAEKIRKVAALLAEHATQERLSVRDAERLLRETRRELKVF